jgi:zinc protease
MYIISQLLSKRYLEEIREKEGGTYGVGVRSVTKIRPTEEVQLSLKFDCDPEKADKLKGIALNEIKSLLNGKVIEEDLEEVKKNLMKVRNEQIEKLNFWHSSLINYVKENKFKMNTEEYLEFVKSTDTNTIIKKANEFLKDAVKIEVIMTAE